MATPTGPLAGIRIVEFNAIGPLPLAGMLMADMGADVVRIARAGDADGGGRDAGNALLYRGRAVIELDLKTQHDDALALIAGADALMEGFRPGVMERLGLGPEPCLAANPRLVYGRITGWGQTGPLAERAGHDINYLGLTGALHAIGSADAPPPPPLNLVADYGGGTMFLVTGLLAALLSARVTGRGQVVDAAMIDGVANMTALFHALRADRLWSDARAANLLDGAAPFYRCYRCADGLFVAVGAIEPQFYRAFLAGIGLDADDWPQLDRRRWPEMADRVAAIFATRPRDAWTQAFGGTDACVTPVMRWDEVADEPHNAARATFVTRDGLTQPAPAPRFSATPGAIAAGQASTVAAVLARWSAAR